MFENKNLIVIGDSFVYGHLGDDMDIESCHARSWVSRLGRIGKFKSVVNLGAPGGSNDRSFSTIYEFLINNYDSKEEYLIIHAVSELVRFQLSMLREDAIDHGFDTPANKPTIPNSVYNLLTIGPWVIDRLATNDNPNQRRIADFLKTYYSLFVHAPQEEFKLSQQLFSLKYMFDSLNIEYYFTETILPPGTIKRFKFLDQTLPTIDYKIGHHTFGLSNFLKAGGHKEYPCGHFDDKANEFLAKYIYQYILNDYKGKKNAI